MAQYQVGSLSSNPNDHKIRTAINLLLSSNSVKVSDPVNNPVVTLTTCSPDVDVIMNKLGGICTRCNTMFKSRISLLSHIERCLVGNYDNNCGNNNNNEKRNEPRQIKSIRPKLIIVSE